MKAAIYLGKENIEIRDLPMPECEENDVIIQNLHSSICGTDVAVFHRGPGTGHRIDIGSEFGHETLDMLHLTYSQKSIIGSGGYMPEDVTDVMEIMKSGRWELEKIVTHEFALTELEAAIRTAEDVENTLNVTIKFDNHAS